MTALRWLSDTKPPPRCKRRRTVNRSCAAATFTPPCCWASRPTRWLCTHGTPNRRGRDMSDVLGVPYLLVEPVNELRATNIPPHCVVRIITDSDPLAFQNLDEILPNVNRIIISQFPI